MMLLKTHILSIRKMSILIVCSVCIISIFSSCEMTQQEKVDKSNTISERFRIVVDSVFKVHHLNPNLIKNWYVNRTMLTYSQKKSGTLELPFSFDMSYSGNPREFYSFDGMIYADPATLKIIKDETNKYSVDINALFKGDNSIIYTVDYLVFSEFAKSTSIVSEYNNDLNKPISTYLRHQGNERKSFQQGLSNNDKAMALLSFRKNENNGCSFQFDDNWLVITMKNNSYPIPAGSPEAACKLFFEKNKDRLRYCSGIRLYNEFGQKRAAYRNPDDKFSGK